MHSLPLLPITSAGTSEQGPKHALLYGWSQELAKWALPGDTVSWQLVFLPLGLPHGMELGSSRRKKLADTSLGQRQTPHPLLLWVLHSC